MEEIIINDLYFKTNVALKVGVEKAIILCGICYWTRHNEANGFHYHDGRYWTYNSSKGFQKIYPFWSTDKIKRMLKSLVDEEYLLTGFYNKLKFDRTLWYSPTDKSLNLYDGWCNPTTMHCANLHNEKVQICTDNTINIPMITKNNNNNIAADEQDVYPQRFRKPTLEEVKAYIELMNLSVNASDFFNYFEAGNWHDSKGKPVKNWKQKLLTWNKYKSPSSQSSESKPKETNTWVNPKPTDESFLEALRKEAEDFLNGEKV